MRLLLSLATLALVLSQTLATEDDKETSPLVSSPGFVTTPGCEDRCDGVEEGAEDCDANTFEGCKCVFADPYCFSECHESGKWRMACAGPPLLPKNEEVPPVSPPGFVATEEMSPPVSPPGFVTTPGCEDRCDGVEEGAKDCDANAFESCKCVIADPYCFSECHESGKWRMACAGPPLLPTNEEVPPVSPPGFVTTPGCEDRCSSVGEVAKTCDNGTFEGCKCVFVDPYCFSECNDGIWMMACAEGGGGDLPPVLTEDGEVPAVSPPDKEVPPVSPPDNEAPPVSPPGFVSTPGCEYKCNGVEEGAKTCDSDAFKGCKCVFADPYCISECDDGGWRMACADGGGGDVPSLQSDDAASKLTTNATTTANSQAPTPSTPAQNTNVNDGDDFSSAHVYSSSGIAAGMTLFTVAFCVL